MIPFRKMHGLGNDFVVIDNRHGQWSLTTDQVRLVSDRRFGVGCDQLIIMEAVEGDADLFMRIYNPDGSESGACGNATRCVASLAMKERGLDQVLIKTRRGNLHATAAEAGDITVDMGNALIDWRDVPLSEEMDTLSLPIQLGSLENPVAVGMGNPHCVFFVEDADSLPLEKLGPQVEHHPLFPERTNVELATIRPNGSIRLRVWERGAGKTLACGSGACATLVAAVRRGLSARQAEIELDGGVLKMQWLENGHVLMTGAVATAFIGELDL
ncbi:diaminopimelate epimerase [Aestuariispira insulae]|uniref:Diaminopimelate epimerase n=1 Tax=Aestuariispira insulae TaxID=1461337 RepID=A0A3D9HGK2_9PROT|nr:diaminopimelate epimerase [Aestuariispira insulae]RED48126.1 diaminopimelate epimerase [Aestuariispira insulae]